MLTANSIWNVFHEIRVMPVQIAVSPASLIFQKRFPGAVSSEGGEI